MKANRPHFWHITLSGRARHQVRRLTFRGTCDEALARADVLESEVPFTVYRFAVVRLRPPLSRQPVTKK